MRYLRQQILNRRSPSDFRVKVDMTNSIVMDTTNNMLLPKGNGSADRPVAPVNGMMRYNTTTNQVEAYQSSSWRSFRFKESTGIAQQTLGPGDDAERHFGPLNPAPPSLVESGSSYGPQNILVFVENVPQIPNTNFVLIQNPCLTTGTVISFAASTKIITSNNTSIINFVTLSFYAGQTIVITGTGSNNGTFTIVAVTASTIEVVESLNNESQGNTITIAAKSSLTNAQYVAGYYIKFNAAVPAAGTGGAPVYVTALHGFDR
jgi:hypothetical protein